MRRPVPARLRVSLALAVCAQATAISAANASPSAHLVYVRAPDALACPDEATLRKAVGARFGYDPFFPWAKQTLVVQIWRDHARYAARVQLVDEQGFSRGTRVLASDVDGCSELFDAVALAISIALDASSTPPKPEAAPAPRETETEPAAPSIEPPPAASLPVPAAVQPALSPPSASSVRFEVGGDVAALANLAPQVLPGASLFVRARRSRLSFALEAQLAASLPWDIGPGRVESALVAAALVPCAHGGAFFLCGVGSIGLSPAWGLGVAHTSEGATIFAAAGARAGVEWPVSARVNMHLDASALIDLARATLQLDTESWRAPLVTESVALGVSTALF